jgi:hypothetical protein
LPPSPVSSAHSHPSFCTGYRAETLASSQGFVGILTRCLHSSFQVLLPPPHLYCRSRRACTVTEAPGVLAAAGATRWPRPHRWRWCGTRPPHWSGRRRSAAWRTRTPGCLSETPRSLKSSGGCLDNRPSQRQCRRRGQWSVNGVGVRSLACPEGSAGCCSWPSDDS